LEKGTNKNNQEIILKTQEITKTMAQTPDPNREIIKLKERLDFIAEKVLSPELFSEFKERFPDEKEKPEVSGLDINETAKFLTR
jgi:hypothetical protein